MADFFADLHRLMEVVAYLDGAASEGGCDVVSLTGEVIDVGSVTYMAEQRARRAAMATGLPESVLMAVWMDAFTVGALFEERGGRRDR